MLRQVILVMPLMLMSAGAMAQPKPAYLIAEFDVTDAARYQKFGVASNSIVKAYGGEFLSRRNKAISAAGDPPKNVTIVMFPSMEKAQAYLGSAGPSLLCRTGTPPRSFVALSCREETWRHNKCPNTNVFGDRRPRIVLRTVGLTFPTPPTWVAAALCRVTCKIRDTRHWHGQACTFLSHICRVY